MGEGIGGVGREESRLFITDSVSPDYINLFIRVAL